MRVRTAHTHPKARRREKELTKQVLVGGLVAGASAVAVVMAKRRVSRRGGGFAFETLIERMPENAPPKWMFRNISAIRENTDRIMRLVEHRDREREPAGATA
jgi:hypothetical protein